MNALEQYVETMSSPEEALLRELERETYLRVINPRMISGHIQGKFMEMLVRMLRPRRILEIARSRAIRRYAWQPDWTTAA